MARSWVMEKESQKFMLPVHLFEQFILALVRFNLGNDDHGCQSSCKGCIVIASHFVVYVILSVVSVAVKLKSTAQAASFSIH